MTRGLADFGMPQSWKCENGEPFNPDALHPVVFSDIINERVLGIRKSDEDDAVIVHSYNPNIDQGRALDFARMVWGKPNTWTVPDLRTKVASCLGTPACEACRDNSLPTMDSIASWRVQSFRLSERLTAVHLPTDSEHLLAAVTDEPDLDRIQAELLHRCVALFGAPYNSSTGEISPIYSQVYESYNQ
jgi:hypothetical protein